MDLSNLAWCKSSYSGNGNDGACVEIAVLPAAVAVRDSKAPSDGVLLLSKAEWRGLVSGLIRV